MSSELDINDFVHVSDLKLPNVTVMETPTARSSA